MSCSMQEGERLHPRRKELMQELVPLTMRGDPFRSVGLFSGTSYTPSKRPRRAAVSAGAEETVRLARHAPHRRSCGQEAGLGHTSQAAANGQPQTWDNSGGVPVGSAVAGGAWQPAQISQIPLLDMQLLELPQEGATVRLGRFSSTLKVTTASLLALVNVLISSAFLDHLLTKSAVIHLSVGCLLQQRASQ